MGLQVGVDMVSVLQVAESMTRFGQTYLDRLFTAGEIAYCATSSHEAPARFAARFAAKEAAVKALRLGDVGINLRDIEVTRTPTGACELALHGATGERARTSGVFDLAVSMSHEGDYAVAVVVAQGLSGENKK